MSNKKFRKFLKQFGKTLFQDDNFTTLEPESPPDWTELGWSVGWIFEEAHTGLQFLVTEDYKWEELTGEFGRNKQQKNQAVGSWYGELIDEWRHELGVPLDLDSLRWRQMDLSVFPGRPLIEREGWWHIQFDSESGSWHLIISERFINVFEEESDSSRKPTPPWTFDELWDRLEARQKQQLMEKIGTDEGVRSHLASIAISGKIPPQQFYSRMQETPREELSAVISERRDMLAEMTTGQENQTISQWKTDAQQFLVETVGELLTSNELQDPAWDSLRSEWNEYSLKTLEETYGTDRWIQLWKQLEQSDLKQLVPRLNTDTLRTSLTQIPQSIKDDIFHVLPENARKSSNISADKLSVFRAREQIFTEGKKTIESMDYALNGEWKLKNTGEK